MLSEEEYLMLHDLAQEQELTIGKVNISSLSRQTGYDRKTIRKYISSPRSHPDHFHHKKGSKLDPFKEYLQQRLEKFPNLSSIRLLEELRMMGYSGGYTILKDYLRTIRPQQIILPEVRYETKPGVQAQVDWADCTYVDPSGDQKQVNFFSMVLGYSRMRYVEFTRSKDLFTFLLCHQHAFDFFGGVTQEILYDNLKTVVLKRHPISTSSQYQPVFAEFRDHYGFTAYLCRPYRAKTKGKIERTIRFVKSNFLYGRTFSSIEDLNIQVKHWIEKINNQEHGTTFEIPSVRFQNENLVKTTLIPPYLIKRRETRKVSNDCFISVFGNRYSIPWRYAGQLVSIEIIEGRLIVESDGVHVCEHRLLDGKHQVSKQKEHFEGLLKAARDESNTKMPPVIVSTRQELAEQTVLKRPLSDYDKISGGN